MVSFSHINKELRALVHTMRQVNALARDVDPKLARMVWGKAIWDTVSSIGIWASVGLAANTLATTWVAHDHGSALRVIIVVGGVSLARACTGTFYTMTSTRESAFRDILELTLRDRIIDKINTLDVARMLDPAFARTLEYAQGRGQQAVETLWHMQTDLVSAVVGVVITAGIVVTHERRLILAGLVLAIPSLLRAVALERFTRRLYEAEHLVRRRKGVYEKTLAEPLPLVQSLFLDTGPSIRRGYERERDRLRENEMRTRQYELRGEVALIVSKFASVVVMLMMLYPLLASGAVGITMLFVLIGTMSAFADGLSEFSKASVSFASKYRDIEYLNVFNSTMPVHTDGTDTISLHSSPPMRLHAVTFTYPGKEEPALRDIDLTIHPGEKVLFVGENGSGKTTLLRLLMRIYGPEAGTVLIAGEPIARFTHASLRRHMAFVLQGTELPSLPLMEAITGCTDDRDVDMARFELAVRTTGVDDFTAQLPHGYRTRIGEDWEDGSGFSTGQRQRLLLAAALYRLHDPQVFIGCFDEALAHCDVELRRRFYEHLTTLRGKTIVVVAHDPMFMHLFERVVELAHGQITEVLDSAPRIRARQAALTAS